jgi:hypothetical protein
MEQLREVTSDRIQALLGVMESQGTTPGKRVERNADETIKTRQQLVLGLKEARIPGNAIVEWCDSQGPLHANVIEFLMYGKVAALDPNSGDKVPVETKKIPDGTWRVLY